MKYVMETSRVFNGMIRSIRVRLLLLFVFICPLGLFGQGIYFNHIGTDNSLSQFSVNSLYIDENGFVWIGTRFGLNCYNGRDIQTFLTDKNNEDSLLDNTVLRITGDGKGKIFILCSEGLCRYDMVSRKFSTMMRGSFKAVCYHEKLYISQNNLIYSHDEQDTDFRLFYSLPDDGSVISSLYITDSTLFIGTVSDGIFSLDIKTDSLSHIVEKGNITSFYEDSRKNLWAGSWENGLFKIAPDGQISNFRHENDNPYSISSDFVRTCCEDELGTIWVGTFNGLNSYDPQSGRFINHIAGDAGKRGLSHSSVWCIQKDRQGTLWLGTYFGGVNYFNPEYEIYTRYSDSAVESEGLSSPIVGRIVEGDGDDLWIATEGGGVNLLDRKTGKFKWFRHQSGRNSLSHDNVKSMYYDKKGEQLWIGTHLGGLNRYELSSGRFTVYRHKEGDARTLPSDIVRDIEPYGDKLIVATQTGVCIFDPENALCAQLPLGQEDGKTISMISDILIDDENSLWVAGTGFGVLRYFFDTDFLVRFCHEPDNANSLSSNNVMGITLDDEGRIWIATAGSGIDLFRPETQDFVNFDSQNTALSSNCIYEIQQSPLSGNLLILSNNSFSIFNPSTKEVRNFDSSNGFPLAALNENSIRVTEKGDIFLGGIEGMISFNEERLNFAPKPYRIILADLIVNGKVVKVGDDTGILKEALYCTPGIKLKATQNMFTFELAVPNYVAANRDEIIYRLEGFSKEWNNTRGDSKITYTNLNPGTYNLVVKAAGNTESYCTPAQIKIRVLPPWYKTKLACCLYFLAIVLIFLYLQNLYKVRIRLQESLRYEKKHIEDIEAMNQSKLRFFTNISHEFRTPLTLIVAEVESLMQAQNYKPSIYNKILTVYKNTVQLRELITELLDFRKQEQGHLNIKVSRHNLVDFLYESYLLFEEYAVTKKIKLEFEKDRDVINVWFDRKQMQKVINNLLSNAVKHTPADGTISLSIRQDADRVIFSVKDTGIGISGTDISKVFERFYQVGQADTERPGTGIGLALTKGIVELHHGKITVESELGRGSEFIVELPLGCEGFSEEEMERNPESTVRREDVFFADKQSYIEEEDMPGPPQGTKMLIVEDNEQIVNMLQEIFRPYYDIRTASNGEEAWELVLSCPPDIIVSDVVMPKMSGIELCKKIKGEMDTCHIPVVLLTARTAVEQNIEGLRIGADDYINKPFSTTLLITRCNNLVNSRVLLQEKFSKYPQISPQVLATNPMDKQFMDKAVRIIDEHISDNEFNIAEFSKEMAMSRTNLFAKFKAITGQTPNDFILTMRLKKGALMLKNNPELNITDISDEIGFGSARYFSKCFKDTYGISPLEYRKGNVQNCPF